MFVFLASVSQIIVFLRVLLCSFVVCDCVLCVCLCAVKRVLVSESCCFALACVLFRVCDVVLFARK